ncbi:hypothetical protein Hanom_Chr14g01259701 [Helianthus anomalus]
MKPNRRRYCLKKLTRVCPTGQSISSCPIFAARFILNIEVISQQFNHPILLIV